MIEFAIAAIPLLLLLVALLFGRYPGCEAALRLAERIASWTRRARTLARNPMRPRLPASHGARGGLLLALGLSGRAPPA
jgi:hypothetical protein